MPNKMNKQKENEEIIAGWSNFIDIDVPISVELGRTKLTVRDVLELNEESIIRLRRSTGEGADLVTDNKIMAKGEIVIIEDNMGVRVNEIVVPVN
jgi:flagellar motor switch protein FliN/FliY